METEEYFLFAIIYEGEQEDQGTYQQKRLYSRSPEVRRLSVQRILNAHEKSIRKNIEFEPESYQIAYVVFLEYIRDQGDYFEIAHSIPAIFASKDDADVLCAEIGPGNYKKFANKEKGVIKGYHSCQVLPVIISRG